MWLLHGTGRRIYVCGCYTVPADAYTLAATQYPPTHIHDAYTNAAATQTRLPPSTRRPYIATGGASYFSSIAPPPPSAPLSPKRCRRGFPFIHSDNGSRPAAAKKPLRGR